MSVYLDDGDVRLYQGDALDTLRLLPDGCVDMVATSPPFYGLRDYGTGEWEGGHEDCDHLHVQGGTGRPSAGANLGNSDGRMPMGRECSRCGARRVDRQIGLEETPQAWVDNLVAVFRECRRVLADHGTLWVEIGDSYVSGQGGRQSSVGEMPAARLSLTSDGDLGRDDVDTGSWRSGATSKVTPARGTTDLKPKDLLGQPWLLAFALRADGWYLRSEIIWARPNPMPESVTDRPTKSHSTVFLLSKQPRYFYDADAIREEAKYGYSPTTNGKFAASVGGKHGSHTVERGEGGTANARSVWQIPTQPTPFAHFATWPQKLVARMIQAGTSERGRCPECGKPWVRDIERTAAVVMAPNSEYGHGAGRNDGNRSMLVGASSTTLGWSPSCDCGEEGVIGQPGTTARSPVPCVVLDPFAGSGTTLLVARNHQRHSIGIELNPDYCKLAAERLQQLSLLTMEGTT